MKCTFTLLFIIALASIKPFAVKSQAVKVEDSLALVDFYNSTSGPNWSYHDNWLTGPVKDWYGISVAANGDITAINLRYNRLIGQIPHSIGNLKALQVLELSDNDFLSTPLPAEIGNLTNLQQLLLAGTHLSGNVPSFLGNLTSLTNLNISSDNLTGTLPESLGNLNKLQFFYAYDNHISGSIPSSFGNMTSLKHLELELNELSGAIPKELGNIRTLNYAAFYINHLSGDIDLSIFNPAKKDMELNIIENYFTFTGTEKLHDLPIGNAYYAYQDTILPLHYNSGVISVSAGGTLSNNIYDWYVGPFFIKNIPGDSTFVPTFNGDYHVRVRNINAKELTLISKTISINDPALPVWLINFAGEIIHGASLLNWQTATEINTAYFNVERSLDGIYFTTVGTVNAAGNSTVVKDYNFSDTYTGPENSIYYRLQEVDKDGKKWASKIVKLSVNTTATAPVIWPNPVTNMLTLKWEGAPAGATYIVTNAEGKQVLVQKQTANTQQLQLNTQQLASGTYILTILTADGQKYSLKFVKQ